MRTYTEEEVLKIVYYACGMQKAESYQEVAHILLLDDDGYEPTDIDIKALDNLYDCNNNYHKSITIEDINDHLE